MRWDKYVGGLAASLFSASLAPLAFGQTTIEFEGAGAPAGGTIAWSAIGGAGITTYSESGFTVSTTNSAITFFGDDTSSGSFGGNLENPNSSGDFLYIGEVVPTLTIAAGGQPFSFDSFLTGTSAVGPDMFEVTGNLAAGGTITTTITAPSNGAGGALTLVTLPVGFAGLTSAVITNTTGGTTSFLIFDSLTFTVVSTPGGGGGGAGTVPSTPASSSPAPVVETPVVEPEPVTIVLLDPVFSSQTSGFVGSIGATSFFTPGLEGHLRSIIVRGEPFRHVHPGMMPRVAWLEERWTGVVHPLAGAAQFPLIVDEPESPWNFWTQGGFENQDQDIIGSHPGFTADSHLGTVGADRSITNDLTLGFAVTGGTKDIEGGAQIGGADIEGLILDAYALWQHDPFWSSLRFGVGWLDIDYERNAFPGTVALGETESLQSVIDWKAGYHHLLEMGGRKFVHGPELGLKYFTSDQEGFTERNADIFNLRYEDYAQSSLISELGWTLAAPLDNKWFEGWIQLRAAWARENIRNESNLDFTFETSPIVSVLDGEIVGRGPEVSGQAHVPTPQDDYLQLGVSLVAHDLGKRQNWTMALDYETQIFRSDYHEHYAGLQLSRRFGK